MGAGEVNNRDVGHRGATNHEQNIGDFREREAHACKGVHGQSILIGAGVAAREPGVAYACADEGMDAASAIELVGEINHGRVSLDVYGRKRIFKFLGGKIQAEVEVVAELRADAEADKAVGAIAGRAGSTELDVEGECLGSGGH